MRVSLPSGSVASSIQYLAISLLTVLKLTGIPVGMPSSSSLMAFVTLATNSCLCRNDMYAPSALPVTRCFSPSLRSTSGSFTASTAATTSLLSGRISISSAGRTCFMSSSIFAGSLANSGCSRKNLKSNNTGISLTPFSLAIFTSSSVFLLSISWSMAKVPS